MITNMATLFFNPFMMIFLVLVTGVLFGKIKFGQFQFGLSGTLFTGLFFGWLVFMIDEIVSNSDLLQNQDIIHKKLQSIIISGQFFDFFIIIFITSVGLTASKDIVLIMKKYGTKFIFLAIVTPLIGLSICYPMVLFFSHGNVATNPYQISGVFTGALTSSPGLAAAIETSSREAMKIGEEYPDFNDEKKQEVLDIISPDIKLYPKDVPALSEEQIAAYSDKRAIDVGVGHAVGYPFGMIFIVLAPSFFPFLFRIRIKDEWDRFNRDLEYESGSETLNTVKPGKFSILAFFVVAIVGQLIGAITVPIGALGTFSLGSVGGTLIAALVLGSRGKIFNIDFRMDENILGALRQIGMCFVLGIVGLRSGGEFVNAIAHSGVPLIVTSLLIVSITATACMFLGRYLLKLNWIVLAGAFCGALTSTPGLAASINALKSDKPASSYGAVYPFALLVKVIVVIILHKLPM